MIKRKKSGLLRRILRFIGFFVIGLILTINLFILLSGRFYLYKGIANTYLIGKTAPGIYDEDVFYNSKIEKSDEPHKWQVSSNYNSYNLSKEDLNYFKELDTKAFLVFHKGEIVLEKYWGEHDTNTVSNAFSAAKTVVALLIGIALEEGKIKSLDEPVANYLPEFKTNGREVVTIRHLLWMSSGLDWEESGRNPLSDNAESYYGTDLRGMIARQKLIEKPGVRFNYQSGNSQILAFVLEKATGQDLSLYCQEKLWKPLGAESDALWNLDKENGDEKAFCCLYATARDYGKIGSLFLNNGRMGDKQIIDSAYIASMSENPNLQTFESVPNLRYGLHVWTYLDPAGKSVYCRGILGQYIIAIPSEEIVIVRLGVKRAGNYTYPEKEKNNKLFKEENRFELGHPLDLKRYIQIAKKSIKHP